jgi:hypothetical protein
MDPRGRFRGYGALWLQRLAQEAVRAAGGLRVPTIYPAVFQALGQAVPVAFMDEGTFVAEGVPSFGLTATYPPEFAQLHQDTYHNPQDTLEFQSAESLGQAGGVAEAVLRQLLATREFPRAHAPYLYFEASASVLQGLPLHAMLFLAVALFAASALLIDRRPLRDKAKGWAAALPHYLGLWLPLVVAVGLLYVFVEVGLLERYAYYFATSKHPAWMHPRWLAIGVWLVALGGLFAVGRRLAARFTPAVGTPPHRTIRSLAFLAIGIAALFVFLTNPFSLIFMLPLFLWLPIRGRRGAGLVVDVLLFLLGGLLIYVLVYFFGFAILRIGLYVLWYLLMMFAIPMIHPAAALAITAILAAGLSLLVRPPGPRPTGA